MGKTIAIARHSDPFNITSNILIEHLEQSPLPHRLARVNLPNHYLYFSIRFPDFGTMQRNARKQALLNQIALHIVWHDNRRFISAEAYISEHLPQSIPDSFLLHNHNRHLADQYSNNT